MPITFVLENTSHPGNIGAAARAMYTMGFEKMILIRPCEITEDAYLRARGGRSIIENAIVSEDLAVLNDFNVIYGTTSRHRSLNLPVYSSKEVVKTILPKSQSNIAVLFGNEKSGLSNALLNLAQAVIEIPAVSGQSLNLSHAIQIIAYELSSEEIHSEPLMLSSQLERDQFIKWLAFYHKDSKFLLPHTLERIRSIINKADLTSREIKLLYSLVAKSR